MTPKATVLLSEKTAVVNSKREHHSAFEIVVLVLIFVGLPVTYTLNFSTYLILLSIAICCIAVIALSARRPFVKHKNISSIHLLFGAYLTWLLIELALYPSGAALARIVQTAGCFLIFSFGVNASLSSTSLKITKRLVELAIFICIIYWIYSGFPLSGFSGFSSNPNSFASMLMCWFVLLLFQRKCCPEYLFFESLCLLLIFTSSSRTVLLSVILLLLIWAAVNALKQKRHVIKLEKISFIVFFTAMIAFVGLYAYLSTSQLGLELNAISQQLFHKDFFSGRQKLWGDIITLIAAHPLTGYGLAALPSQFLDFGWSSHNLFLQTALQSGLPGMIILCLIIIQIAFAAAEQPSSTNSIIIFAFTFALVLHESLEICLTQNVLCCGLMMWCLLGFGYSCRSITQHPQNAS